MNKLLGLWARIKVVLSAAVTWIVVAQTVIVIFRDEVSKVLPTPFAERFEMYAATVLAVLAAVVAVIRRVTPVEPEWRGLLNPWTQF